MHTACVHWSPNMLSGQGTGFVIRAKPLRQNHKQLGVQVTSFLSAGEEDGAFSSWQGRLGLVSEKLRACFLQLADPPLDLPGTQVGRIGWGCTMFPRLCSREAGDLCTGTGCLI